MYLRAFERGDIDAYRELVTSRDALLAGYRLPTSADQISDWYEAVRAKHGKEGYYFVVSPVGGEEFIGTTWLWNLDARALGGAELSAYVADPSRRGQGIGTDAVNATLDFAFGYTRIGRVWLTTPTYHLQAQRCFEKAGFVREGVVRQADRRQGELIDTVLMAILRSEWEALERPRSWDFDA